MKFFTIAFGLIALVNAGKLNAVEAELPLEEDLLELEKRMRCVPTWK